MLSLSKRTPKRTPQRTSLRRRAVPAGWAACLLLTACAHTTPQWDARFGDAARMTLAQQVAHPEAARNADPVAGIDGAAAAAAYARYLKQFDTPQAQPATFTIGVSGAK